MQVEARIGKLCIIYLEARSWIGTGQKFIKNQIHYIQNAVKKTVFINLPGLSVRIEYQWISILRLGLMPSDITKSTPRM